MLNSSILHLKWNSSLVSCALFCIIKTKNITYISNWKRISYVNVFSNVPYCLIRISGNREMDTRRYLNSILFSHNPCSFFEMTLTRNGITLTKIQSIPSDILSSCVLSWSVRLILQSDPLLKDLTRNPQWTSLMFQAVRSWVSVSPET